MPLNSGRMTLRIQKITEDNKTILFLSGQLVSSELKSLLDEIEGMATTTLDLAEVTLVDMDTVQFLARCEANGVELLHCSAYIREWTSRESARAAGKRSEE